MAFQIRKLGEGDWPEACLIYQQGMDTGQATMETRCPSYPEWDAAHLKAFRLAALEEGKVIGWAALTPVSGRCVYAGVAEVSVYIARDHRGKGAGRALLTELIRCSGEFGFWTLQSGIMMENTASIHLHERCGFRMAGWRERIGRDRSGQWRDTVLMERRSADPRFGGDCPKIPG